MAGTSVFVTPTTFYFTNLGDSRTVLNRGTKLAFQTRDHKPYNQHERNRIKDAGGFVMNGRVDGGLAVSRAFGDFIYKQRPDLPAAEQKVSAEPTVDAVPREHDKDNFLLLACDGVWDVMSSESGSKFVNSRLKKAERRTPEGVELTCRQLVDRTLNLGSRDNVSVLIICFERAVKDKGHKKKGNAAAATAAAAAATTAATTAAATTAAASAVAAAAVEAAVSDAAGAITRGTGGDGAADEGEEDGEADIPFVQVSDGTGDDNRNDNGDDDDDDGNDNEAEEDEDSLVGVISEAVVFSAIERALSTMAGGGGTRFTRRDTITGLP